KTSAFPAFLPLRLPTFTTVYTTARIWGCRSGQPVVTGLAAATVTHTFKECHHVRKSSYPTRQARQAPTRLPAHARPGGLLVQTHSRHTLLLRTPVDARRRCRCPRRCRRCGGRLQPAGRGVARRQEAARVHRGHHDQGRRERFPQSQESAARSR